MDGSSGLCHHLRQAPACTASRAYARGLNPRVKLEQRLRPFCLASALDPEMMESALEQFNLLTDSSGPANQWTEPSSYPETTTCHHQSTLYYASALANWTSLPVIILTGVKLS